nr:PREDICTED: inactive ubiquitin carboxyl-terminal hydrolase 53 [Lepisosteus oculatus]XP_015201322.1 PREDICTED: inactive ubiquitin carboxyl-terminal hydrolase 53 [Lepisosteus oculatus]
MAWVKFFKKQGGNLGKSYQPGSMLSLAPTKGLLNEPGQNSCFLNSAVQVLWQLDVFRRSLRQLPGHVCLGEACIFCALKSIFSQFQHSRERALPSDNLRHALAETFKDEQRFQLGFMDDAAECFENILERIHLHIVPDTETDVCVSKSCITHQKFAMTLYEQCVCRSCGASSDPLPFTELVHYVSTTALCQQVDLFLEKNERLRYDMFGELLQAASTIGDLRNCPSNCGQRIKIRRVLMNCPEIVTIGFVWDAEQSDLTEDVIRSLGPQLNLSGLFYRVTDEQAKKTDLILVGMICYTSKHYCAFAYHTKSSKWVFFDDATVKEVGSKWKDVVSKCIRGHFQPLLLFYSNPDGTAVSTEDAPRQTTLWSHYKSSVNGDGSVHDVPVSAAKKLELTKENVSALLSNQSSFKQKLQPSSNSGFIRGAGQTSGRRGPVKIMPGDPKSKLREISREVAQKAGEVRTHLQKKEIEKGQRRQESGRHRDMPSDKTYPSSENGFRQNTDQRLYSSQGKGPSRNDKIAPPGRAHEPRLPANRVQVLPGLPSGQSKMKQDVYNGYDTDSSQDFKEKYSGGRSKPKAWKPMRETLNVDSVFSGPEKRQHSPKRRPPNQGDRTHYDQEHVTSWPKENRKQKSLMTIYEDEQKHETGSKSSLESEGKVHAEKERTKGGVNNKVRNDTWKMQRTESGYESSDRLSNGSTNLDSPVVENFSSKDLRPIPEVQLSRDQLHHNRCDESVVDSLHSSFSYGEQQIKRAPEKDFATKEGRVLSSSPCLQRRQAIRNTSANCERNKWPDGDPVFLEEKHLQGNGEGYGNGNSSLQYLQKTSSSEWNSSDDLNGPMSEQEDNTSIYGKTALLRSGIAQPFFPGAAREENCDTSEPIYQNLAPPLPPKKYAQRQKTHLDDNRSTLSATSHLHPLQSDAAPPSKVSGSPPLTLLNNWAASKYSANARSKPTSSNQERMDLFAKHKNRNNPKLDMDVVGPSEEVLTTTYFSVDSCMTDSYRSRYHHQRSPLYYKDSKGGDQTSSGESELGDTNSMEPSLQSNLSKARPETGYSTNKTAVKWNPVSTRNLDEHGYL